MSPELTAIFDLQNLRMVLARSSFSTKALDSAIIVLAKTMKENRRLHHEIQDLRLEVATHSAMYELSFVQDLKDDEGEPK